MKIKNLMLEKQNQDVKSIIEINSMIRLIQFKTHLLRVITVLMIYKVKQLKQLLYHQTSLIFILDYKSY